MSSFEQGNLKSFLDYARARKGPDIHPQPKPVPTRGIVIPEVVRLLHEHGANIVYKRDFDLLPQYQKDAVNLPFEDDAFVDAARQLNGTNHNDLLESAKRAAHRNVDPATIKRFSNEFNQEYFDPFED